MYDSVRTNLATAERRSKITKRLGLRKKEFYLVTLHRAENADSEGNLRKLTKILAKLDGKVIFPIHPRTKRRLAEFKLLDRLLSGDRILLIDPVSYLDMLVLEKNARYVLTDSGGVQKEAFFLGTPCLTLRKETEWVETLRGGFNHLVGLDAEKVVREIKTRRRLSAKARGKTMLTSKGASVRIAKVISRFKVEQ
jgi:UDP-N-acetylglucosamine 2-epimerase